MVAVLLWRALGKYNHFTIPGTSDFAFTVQDSACYTGTFDTPC